MDFNVQISMYRVGNCLDNTVIESFHVILKTEGLKKFILNQMNYLKTLIILFLDIAQKRINIKTGLSPTHIV